MSLPVEPFRCFELLIEHAKKTEMPAAFRLEVIRQLEYFKAQSLCDLDRRDPPLTLRENWRIVKGQTRGLKFLESYKADEHFWRIVQAFVYEVEPCSVIIPRPEKPPRPASKCDNWKPFDFFNHLINQLDSRVQFSEEEKYMILHGLYFLRAESERAPGLRDEVRMRQVWARVHRYLERVGLMAEFKEEEKLKSAIRYFIDRAL
ncbi:hypothetical protein [Bdellovibrio svalbardensis]|uniref:Uncharacterized protein n=1 Tax=Bdellovibrio svalbardensis TaxID=2972972 RepID=A0ABT6DKU0_9BACT|nr:hypothetical protein [Bdellovibrio svalbardensis]MDG0816451.1 hypothetical protein [Bdellovibrio svalbardensis]